MSSSLRCSKSQVPRGRSIPRPTIEKRGTPPNKALQLTSHSAFESIRGTFWHRNRVLRATRPAGQAAERPYARRLGVSASSLSRSG